MLLNGEHVTLIVTAYLLAVITKRGGKMKQYIQFTDYDDEFSAVEKLNKFIASEKNKNVTVEGYQQVKYEQTNNERTYILVSYEEVE